MRILLTHHFPLGQSAAGWLVWQWAVALMRAGDEVRVLTVDETHHFDEPFVVDRVICGDDPNADLRFPLPGFSTPADHQGATLFTALSTSELSQYRDRLRRRLDTVVLQFDPQVIHAQHIWVLGQLALESGVPYVVNAWQPELVDLIKDERYRALAELAAENASRILVPDVATQEGVLRTFESSAERLLMMGPELNLSTPQATSAAQATASDALRTIYKTVLSERFG